MKISVLLRLVVVDMLYVSPLFNRIVLPEGITGRVSSNTPGRPVMAVRSMTVPENGAFVEKLTYPLSSFSLYRNIVYFVSAVNPSITVNSFVTSVGDRVTVATSEMLEFLM